MRINFVLPRSINVPMGGYKIIFQYANFLAEIGHDVYIYFVIHAPARSLLLLRAKIIGMIFKRNKYRQITWFKLHQKVHLRFDVSSTTIEHISSGKLIATHWSTAKIVSKSRVDKNNKFYFLQDLETFDRSTTPATVIATWKLPLRKIVISKWLLNKAHDLGVKAVLIPNFIDLQEFSSNENLPSKKRGAVISFLWHKNPRKQSQMGLAVAKRLKKSDPDIKVITFGTTIIKSKYIDQTFQNASPQTLAAKIYGKSAVYMMPSCSEGWGLTGLEAMANGAAVVAVNNGGINEYAQNGISAKIVPNSEDELFNACLKMLEDNELRSKFVQEGYRVAKKFSLARSSAKLIRFLGSQEK